MSINYESALPDVYFNQWIDFKKFELLLKTLPEISFLQLLQTKQEKGKI